jgi:hypothetical protein
MQIYGRGGGYELGLEIGYELLLLLDLLSGFVDVAGRGLGRTRREGIVGDRRRGGLEVDIIFFDSMSLKTVP